jgi:hypothetical protein
MKNNQHIADSLNAQRTKLATFDSMLAKLPEGTNLSDFGVSDLSTPTLFSYVEHDESRLVRAAEIFGTDGWTAVPSGSSCYDWKKTVHGVVIDLRGAQVMPDLVERPVKPSEFPLQLPS